jgi:glycosyltransferase involved in cell wall biosynthesis
MNSVQTAVIIPCYNLGRFVEEALDSALAQTRAPSEVVIVDDGSSDIYTRQILAGLERPKTRVVRTGNQGLPAARNLGIRLTSAPYIVTLDADDVLEPTYLERTAEQLDADPHLGFVSTGIQAFGDATWIWTPPPCDLLNALTQGAAHPATLFRRTVWDAIGGFDESLVLGAEDLDFWISAIEHRFQGSVLPEPLFRYRVRGDSLHHGAVARGTYRAVMETVLRKHRKTVESLGPDVLMEKERFLVDMKKNLRHLERRRAELEQEIASIGRQTASLIRVLAERGESPVDWGDLRRLQPLSPVWGFERGQPIDRRYIEDFLSAHRSDIRGSVLEVKDSVYTDRFSTNAVAGRNVLDVDAANSCATIVADLSRADGIASDRFDCFILTQTLHIIYDVKAALAHAYRILKPGGVLLCTLPAVSRVNYEDGGLESGDYWRFTEASVRRLFAEVFPIGNVDVTVHGNVLTCAAFLYGLSAEELTPEELAHVDRWFPLLFCVRAVKPGP